MVLKKKQKNFGKKKMKKNKLNDDRKFILHESLKLINNNGWNDNLFELISKQNNIELDIITSLFPDGYKDLLKYWLDVNHLERF